MVHAEPFAQGNDDGDDFLPIYFQGTAYGVVGAGFITDKGMEKGGVDQVFAPAQDARRVTRADGILRRSRSDLRPCRDILAWFQGDRPGSLHRR